MMTIMAQDNKDFILNQIDVGSHDDNKTQDCGKYTDHNNDSSRQQKVYWRSNWFW